MKIKKVLLTMALSASLLANAQQTEVWNSIGDQLTTTNPGYTALEFDSQGNCYFAYSNQNANSSLNVQKFNGSTWSAVGSADFTSGQFVRGKDIALDTNGVPYVAFANGLKDITVVKFNGTAWDTVGVADFASTDGLIGNPDIEIDPTTNNPIVAFHDDSSDKLSVMMWNGTSWGYLNSGQDISTGTVSLVSMTIDNSGVVFVGYADENTMLAVQSTWVGGVSWSVNAVDNNTQTISALDIDTDGIYPVLTYIDLADEKVYARRYSGSPTWYRFDQPIGTADFYDIVAVQRRGQNTIIGFSDTDNLYGPESFRINDTDFLTTAANADLIGSPGGLGVATPYNMVFGLNEGDTLYVAFGNLTVEVYQLVALSQASIETNVSDMFNVYPNPATNQFTINGDGIEIGSTLNVLSLDGKVLLTQTIQSNNQIIDVSALAKGTYLVQLNSVSNHSTKKITIQ